MKCKIMAFLIAMLSVGMLSIPSQMVYAEDTGVDIDYSYLTTEEALIGRMQSQTRGVYLLEGSSTITKLSTLTIGAGGTTSATQKCEVAVLVIVEQLKDGAWSYWHSWKVTEENDYTAMASKALAVARGYSYRVRCTHYAASDVSSSWTGALRM